MKRSKCINYFIKFKLLLFTLDDDKYGLFLQDM